MLAQELLPDAAQVWLQNPDNSRLHITTRDAGGVLSVVSARRAELGLAKTMDKIPGIRSLSLARCRTLCALPSDHPLCEKKIITPPDLHDQRYIALSRHEGMQTELDTIFERYKIRPVEVVECPLIVGAGAMALAGVGITFQDPLSARSLVPRGLVLRPFEPAIIFDYRAIWVDELQTRFDRAGFLRLLRETAQKILAETDPQNPLTQAV
jgi:DNA-binding transcriptional LysR family regulator